MARKRNQHGSIRVLSRKSGDVFEYRYYRTRADGERVPVNFVVGTVDKLGTEAGAWARIRNMGFDPNVSMSNGKPITFGDLDNGGTFLPSSGPSESQLQTGHLRVQLGCSPWPVVTGTP